MNEFEELTRNTRTIIRNTRHGAELPLRIIAIVFGALIYVMAGVFGLMLRIPGVKGEYIELLAEYGYDEASAAQVLNVLGKIGFACLLLALACAAVILIVSIYRQYALEMSYAVKVSPKNFPEIYEKSCEMATKLGLKKLPEVYVAQENGSLNAFSAKVFGKNYLQLNSEIVDIAYMENKDFDTVYFVMAHEMGHIYFRHVGILYNLMILIFRLIPIIGPALSRAQEYSADRVAQALCDDRNSVECMMLLAAGRHLYKHADVHDYLERINMNHNWLERFARLLVNLFADHPIAPFRTRAILDPQRKSGRLF